MVIDKKALLFISLHRQQLLEKAPCKTVVSNLCGLQAQFANNPKYALRIRGSDFDEKHWHEGLVKTWTLRGTLHTILSKELGLFLSARGALDGWHPAWNLESRRMEYWSDFLLEQIAGGIYEREALKRRCVKKGMAPEELQNVFHGWGGLIYEMSRRGLIAYHPGTVKRFVLCRDVAWIGKDEARAVLLRRYFQVFGPATIEDFRYFTGYKSREIKTLLGQLSAELSGLSCGGKEYWYLGELPGFGELPSCVFLSGFDQLLMGYLDRSRLMDEQFKPAVTTNTGIVFPTVLLRGRVQAKWKKDGRTLYITPFSVLKKKEKSLIAETGEEIFAGGIRETLFCDETP
ncbi:MAG: winged helix DNA-binding domain-containing protein [Treponema sp.]|jgi:hypothetical protein|nr:winged helix DNA-binding domain-containing protein [Treponema sp.]